MVEVVFDSAPSGRAERPGAAVTLGTFDGVHLGHRAVLRVLLENAAEHEAESVIVTFEPHPLRVVRPEAAPPLLTSFEERRDLLLDCGADRVVFLHFTPELAALSAEQFVDEVLVRHFGMAHLVVGHDHGLGRGRTGDVDTLREIGRESGFDVTVVGAETFDGRPVSSTRIRNALAEGDVEEAAFGLGRPYAMRCTVVKGEGQGRELGFPTANLSPDTDQKLVPREGIYAATARLRDGTHVIGALHVGPRPTFEGLGPSIELHILDFDRDLYGEPLELHFCRRLRDIVAFDSADALVDAMRDDVRRVRELFRDGGGACQGSAFGLRYMVGQ